MMDDTKILDLVLGRLKPIAVDGMPLSPKRAALLIEQIGALRGQRIVSDADPLDVTAAEFPQGARVKHEYAGYGTVNGRPYYGGKEICVPVRWDNIGKADAGWFARLMERVPDEFPTGTQDFWRCKHHPSAINNYYIDRDYCGYGCEKNELRWFDNGCKPATS